MTFFSELIADLREAKAAAESHNVSNYEPPSTSNPTVGKPADGNLESDKPSSESNTTTAAAQSSSQDPTIISSGSTGKQQAYIPPPPPPKNLPHGWTARYDQKEGKFSYSHGVESKNEQWDFPTEKTT